MGSAGFLCRLPVNKLMLIFLELEFCYANCFYCCSIARRRSCKGQVAGRACILVLSPLQMAACKLCPFNTMPAVSLLWYLSQPWLSTRHRLESSGGESLSWGIAWILLAFGDVCGGCLGPLSQRCSSMVSVLVTVWVNWVPVPRSSLTDHDLEV